MRRLTNPLITTALAVLVCPPAADAASVDTALKLAPVQDDVDYDRPTGEDAKACKLRSEKTDGGSGWIVTDGSGRLLRRFLDTNDDNRVDLWCYYKDGIEVYRDVDADFNGKADQYRWLGTAGIRWGLDQDEDGRIDRWRQISAEEVTLELVAAIRDGDAERYHTLLPSRQELDALKLGQEKSEQVADKIKAAAAGFRSFVRTQKLIDSSSKWVHFGGSRPGVVPAGTDGSTADLTVYENVVAVVETGGKHAQLYVGTLVQTDAGWRTIDLPRTASGDELATGRSGFFFRVSLPSGRTPADDGDSERMQQLILRLEKVDKSLLAARTKKEREELHGARADVIEAIAQAAPAGKQRESWLRQLADALSAAVQSGEYPPGVDRLEKLARRVADGGSKSLAAYAKYRWMSARYAAAVQQPDADFRKIQEEWLGQLRSFVRTYPKSPDVADALMQLAVADEFAGEDDSARAKYKQIVDDFPDSAYAKKAAGALVRLDSVGKTIRIRGTMADGRKLDTAGVRGKLLVIHYWATWCEPCKEEMKTLKQLQAKYGSQGLQIVGVNLDSEKSALTGYVDSQRIGWPQVHDAGGLDGRLATQLGVVSLPLTMLLDSQGRVVNRNIHAPELEDEIKKRLD